MRVMMAGLAVALGCMPAMGQIIGQGPVVANTPVVATLNTGTAFWVTAAVSPDQRYVTIQIQLKQSSLEGIDVFNLSGVRLNGSGAGVAGGGGGLGGGGAAGVVGLGAVGGVGRSGAVGGAAALAVTKAPPKAAEPGSLVFVDIDKKLLSAEVPAMTLQGKSLKDAVRTLGETTKTNLVLGIRGLELAQVDVNAAHDFTISQGTLKDALEEVVKTAAPKSDIVISAQDAVVQVMSQAQADDMVVTRIYYAEDLAWNVPQNAAKNSDSKTLKDKDETSDKPAVIVAGAAGPVTNYDDVIGYRAPGRPAAMAAGARTSTSIVEMITSTVRPEIWKINGGKIGEIAVVGNLVTITAPESVQAALDGPKHFDPNARPLYIGYQP